MVAMNTGKWTRREALGMATTAAAMGSLGTRLQAEDAAAGMKGRVRHSVCKWCYPNVSLEELCRMAPSIGLGSIELLGPKDWPVVASHGLTCAITGNPVVDGVGGITKEIGRAHV